MRRHGRHITGILLLDKPGGITSNRALQRVKRLFDARKAGHTGSLDPLATGILPICLGEATKVSGLLLEADKHYRVTARFGAVTDTGDAEGEVVARAAVGELDWCRVEQAAATLTGAIEQVPPMYSALKHEGRRLYELAREGREVERAARPVTIHAFELLALRDDEADLRVHCSKGTYVRTLVEALGERLGPRAHVTALRRTAVDPFDAQPALVTLERLMEIAQQSGKDALDACLLPMDAALTDWPALELPSAASGPLRQGQTVSLPATPRPGPVRLYSEAGRFLGTGSVDGNGRLAPKRLLAQS